MFGEYKLSGELFIEKHGLKISVKETTKGIFKYYRCFQNISTIKTVVSENPYLGIYPLPPIGLRPFTVEHVYLKLRSPITLSPNKKTEIYFKAPANIGVTVLENEKHIIIDNISLVKEKYALYGPIESGVLCRFYVTDAYNKEPLITLSEAVVKAKVINESNNFIEISKLIIPVSGAKLFYSSEQVYYGLVEVIIEAENEIIIKHLNEPIVSNISQAPITIGQPKEYLKMEWGI